MEISVETIVKKFKICRSLAIEIWANKLLTNRRIYVNRGNNAAASINSLKKNFGISVITQGNDAPKGGKIGDYIEFESTEAFEVFAKKVLGLENSIIFQNKKRQEERTLAVNAMVITEEEKVKFLSKVEGLSRKQARKVAHHYAGKKLNFYSTEGMARFMDLIK